MKNGRYFSYGLFGLFFLLIYFHYNLAFATTFTVPTNGMQAYTQQFFATINESTPSITFEWPSYNGSSNLTYDITRKLATSTTWSDSLSGVLASTTLTWTDTDIDEGVAYEYQLRGASNGYLYSGFKIDTTFDRGRVILLVESSVATPLETEINRLKKDLIGDGWEVVQINVSSSTSVASVKEQIVSEYNNDPSNTTALFIIGHVAVPYSGSRALDGHYPQHEGAWATDTFYGDMNGTWTDSTVNKSVASYTRNYNTPGDGKYDQNLLPSSIELAVGRVDFYNMPAFGLSEVELLRRYLDKDHNYRNRVFTVRNIGLMGDNFGTSVYTSQTAWNNMTGLLGTTAIENRGSSYLSYVASSTYIMTYGNGGGTFTSASGIGTTAQFAASSTYGVFNSIFGSYFGDWDNQNNLLKAPLAGAGYGLTNMWGGWPAYHLHLMGLGGTIGESIVLTQNNGAGSSSYKPTRPGYNSIEINLMGDPTLRMYMITPPDSVDVEDVGGGEIGVSWNASPDSDILGYYVLRSTSEYGIYELATTTRLETTSYNETLPTGSYYYMVRAEKLEETPSGSFYNKSQGTFSTSVSVTNNSPVVDAGSDITLDFLTDDLTINATTTDDGGYGNLSITWSMISGPGTVTFSATTSTSTSVTFSEIGNYILRLTATDGTSTSHDDVTVVVEDEFDAESPSVVTGLFIDVMSDTSISISWTSSTDSGTGGGTASGLAGYVIYRDDVAIATTTETQYLDTSLTQNTSYEYHIVAFDYNENFSNPSDASSGTTEYTPINPEVSTDGVSSISTTGATLSATLESLGYVSVIEVGFIYSTSTVSTTTVEQYVSTDGDFELGSFSDTLSDLTCGTTYYYRSYARNSVGYGYGEQSTFDTASCPVADTGGSGGGGGGGGGSSGSRSRSSDTESQLVVSTSTATSTVIITQNTTIPSIVYSINRKQGDIGQDILSLQKSLNLLKYFVSLSGPGSPGSETNYFGELTKQAVIKFQLANSLPVTGMFDDATRVMMNNVLASNNSVIINSSAGQNAVTVNTQSPSGFSRNLDLNYSGSDVKALQKYLNNKGYIITSSGPGSPGNETEYFGALTRSALARFQSANGISPAVGYLGPITRAYIQANP